MGNKLRYHQGSQVDLLVLFYLFKLLYNLWKEFIYLLCSSFFHENTKFSSQFSQLVSFWRKHAKY